MVNVGFFVRSDPSSVVLASCFDPETGTFRWIDTLPTVLIREIEKIEVSLS